MTTGDRPFEGCWERVARADSHREVLRKLWSEFLDDDPYSVGVYVDPKGAGEIWVQPRHEALPAAFALELGEVLYQLRAALDASVYQAAIIETGQDPPPYERDLEFPICTSAADFNNSAAKIRPLTDQRRAVVELIQPYNTPPLPPEHRVFSWNIALRILNDWSRKDRHRKLHVVGSWPSNIRPKVDVPDGTRLAWLRPEQSRFLEQNCIVARFAIDGWTPGMHAHANPDLAIDVAVDEVPPPKHDNDTLGQRLLAMSMATRAVISAFEKSFGLATQ